MEQFATNPFVTLFGLLLGIFGSVSSYVFYRRSIRDKEPYWAIQTVNLFKDYSSTVDGLEVKYSGEKIRDLSVSKVAFWNSGRLTVDKMDLTEQDPLRIQAGGESRVLSAQLISKNNVASQPVLSQSLDRKKVFLEFDYLDQGQGFVVQVIHEGTSSQDIELKGSIKGVGRIHKADPSKPMKALKRELLETFWASLLLFILGGIAAGLSTIWKGEVLVPVATVLFLIGIVGVIIAILQLSTLVLQARNQVPHGLESLFTNPRESKS